MKRLKSVIESIGLALAILLLGCGCQSPIPIAPVSIGTISAHTQTIRRIADESKKTASSSADATAFGEISAETTALDVGIKSLQDLVNNLQKRLASALDTAKLRDSMIFLVPIGLIICVGGFAAWGYFKFRWLEYVGVGGGGIAVGAIILYLAIQTIQQVLVWLVPIVMICGIAGAVILIIKNRKKTSAEMAAATVAALNNTKEVAVGIISDIQSSQTKAVVAQAVAERPDLLNATTPV